LRNVLQRELPPFLSSVAPYRIIGPILTRGTDGYIAALTHESFHAFQGIAAGGRLEEAERTNLLSQDHYFPTDPDFVDAWQVELDLLAEALKTSHPGETRQLVKEFLSAPADRRKASMLAPAQYAMSRSECGLKDWPAMQSRAFGEQGLQTVTSLQPRCRILQTSSSILALILDGSRRSIKSAACQPKTEMGAFITAEWLRRSCWTAFHRGGKSPYSILARL
jgi:hypothetical protein